MPNALPTPAIHPAILQTVQQGVAQLFGGAPPAAMDAGGGVPMAPQDAPGSTTNPLTMDAGGEVPQSPMVPTAALPGPGGALVAGFEHGRNLAAQTTEANRQTDEYNEKQAAHGDMEKVFEHLQSAGLNDAGEAPGSQSAVPTPDAGATGGAAQSPAAVPAAPGAAPAASPAAGAIPAPGAPAPTPADATSVAAVQKAASDPNAQQGVPQQSPTQSGKKAHSITTDFWDENNRLMLKAIQSATKAGYDPNKVMDSMMAVRNGFMQSNILRNLSAANVALQSGDTAAVEKAMRNVYYYLPDGKDLTVKHDADGNILYQDPMEPYVEQDGKKVPNMVPITAQHLQELGLAAMDPQKVGELVTSLHTTASKQRVAEMEAAAKGTTANAQLLASNARLQEAKARGALVPSSVYKNLAEGDKARAQAGYFKWRELQLQQGKGTHLDPTELRRADDAAKFINTAALGTPTVAPTEVPDPNHPGQMMPSLSPNAGRQTYDTSKADPRLKGANAAELVGLNAVAGDITTANPTMSPAAAAEFAIRAYDGSKKFHSENGRRVPNAVTNKQAGYIKVWNEATKKYDVMRISNYAAQRIAVGGMSAPDEASLNATDEEAAQGGDTAIPADEGGGDSEDGQ